MADSVGQQLGNYRLIRLLGRGSFADVYLGEHVYLKTQAAVKVLHTQLSDRDAEEFLNEAQTLARLIHPHIIRTIDFNVQEGRPFLVVDYASNGTLRQRHSRGTTVPLSTIADYVRQIADALQYAHNQRLIHRDVKPENMLLGPRNEVLLSDFGTVLVAQSTLLQQTQKIAGTVAYMSPEQLQGKPCFASDQYALGIVVYEWLSGNRPFQGSFTEVVRQQIFAPPPPLYEKVPSIPYAVAEVVMTALAKDFKQRFASVQAFANALGQACSSTNAPPSPPLTKLPTASIVARQLPVTPIPPITSEGPGFTDLPAQVQQQLSSVPTPFIPPTQYTSSAQQTMDKSAIAGESLSHAWPGQSLPVQTNASFELPSSSNSRGELPQQHKNKARRNIFLAVLVTFIIAATPTTYFILLKRSSPGHLPTIGIGVSKAPDGEYIGLSDGSFAFDTNRPGGALKMQAANELKGHNISGAESLWQSALLRDTSDAEASIYLEDQRVLASHAPYLTLVVSTQFTDDFGVGHDDLQGAYVAQKEYNDDLKLPGGVQVRLLIASSGNVDAYAITVAQQIVQAARTDRTIVGVMGWPYINPIGYMQDTIKILTAAHMPMVSQTASFDFLTGISPYFFRVMPSNKRQVFVMVQYAEHLLHTTRAVLFVDHANMYSKEVASDLERQFIADGNAIAATESYTVGHPQSLPGLLRDGLSYNPNLIYFAGYADDVSALMTALPTSGPFADLHVIGGDHLFGSYLPNAKAKLYRLHFTVFLTGGIWEFLGLSAKKPIFFTEYEQDFDPLKQHKGDPFGYTRADNDAMLSYDAMLALLTGSKLALAGISGGKKIFSPGDLQQALTRITGSRAIQGVSGQIAFGSDGDASNKTIVLVKFDANGYPTIDSVQGSFLVGS